MGACSPRIFMNKTLFTSFVTVFVIYVRDELFILESLLTTFEVSIIFMAAKTVTENGSSLKSLLP